MKPIIVTAFTHNPEDAYEKMDYKEPSVTIPDEAYTIEDLMRRHRAGLFTDVKTPIFLNDDTYSDEDASLDDVDFEKMSRADLVDQAEHLVHLSQIQRSAKGRAERTEFGDEAVGRSRVTEQREAVPEGEKVTP